MISAFFGFTILLAALTPAGTQIAQIAAHAILPVGQSASPVLMHLVVLLFSYAPAALLVAWFFKASKLGARLPSQIPGRRLMMYGVGLTCAYFAVYLFSLTIQGGGATFVVAQMSIFALWPARALLVVGAVKVLLAAKPSGVAIGPAATARAGSVSADVSSSRAY